MWQSISPDFMGVEPETVSAMTHVTPSLQSHTHVLLYLQYLQVWNISYLQL